MKLIRYQDALGKPGYAWLDADGSARRLHGAFPDFTVTDEVVEPVKLLAPLEPTAIYCIGLNYRAHAEETGGKIPDFPIVFMKANTAVQNPGDPIIIPRFLASHEVDYEVELAVVIGKRCKNVAREQALDYVFGYTVANDVSARDWQIKWGGRQFVRGKTFDTFCPLGPAIITADEAPDPSKFELQTHVNGELRQKACASDMIFSVSELIAFISGSTTLLPGTLILTGTPSGVGIGFDPPKFLAAGDQVDLEIAGIGKLSNPVAGEVLE